MLKQNMRLQIHEERRKKGCCNIERDVEMNRSQSQKRENGEYIGVHDTIDTLEYIDRID